MELRNGNIIALWRLHLALLTVSVSLQVKCITVVVEQLIPEEEQTSSTYCIEVASRLRQSGVKGLEKTGARNVHGFLLTMALNRPVPTVTEGTDEYAEL